MNIYLVKRNVTVPQEYKSDKEKKKGKKSNLLLYNKSSFKRSRFCQTQNNQTYCFKLTILYHNHVGLNLKLRARASGKLIDQKWKNISSKCCYWDPYY
jgi:hypothetical protein